MEVPVFSALKAMMSSCARRHHSPVEACQRCTLGNSSDGRHSGQSRPKADHI